MRAAKITGGKTGARTPSFSTSVGRANFARALEITDQEKTVVGFDRYNRPVAALVPIEAVSILAGKGGQVDAAVRARIVRMARLFLSAMPANSEATTKSASKRAAKPGKKKAAKQAAKRKKTKGKPPARRKNVGNRA